MGLGRIRLLFAMAVGLMTLAATGTAGAAQSCPTRLLDDWRDGRIDQLDVLGARIAADLGQGGSAVPGCRQTAPP